MDNVRYLILLLSILFWSTTLSAQYKDNATPKGNTPVSKLLSGTPIGSPSVDYDTGNTSKTKNTPADAFDNNYNTFYASYNRFYTYVGLDLGKKHVITMVAYAPRAGWDSRLELGVFEGANNPDFSDALPLYIIGEKPEYQKMTYATINCSRGFRYVRYVGPNDARCNISELKFYGYQSEGDDSKLYQMTNLPLVVIHTEKAQDITSLNNYIKGIVSIISNGGHAIFKDSLEIRGRGNGSWTFPKKPYKMKLSHKAKPLGMKAKAKKWTLINNYGDKTMLRNLLAMETSRCLDMEYTPQGKLVDVMLNGEYKGTYQLFDQIEVGKNRIDIEELTPSIVSGDDLTGGYHIEIDAYAEGAEKFVSKKQGLTISLKYPDSEDINIFQRNYIINAFNEMETRLFSGIYTSQTFGYRACFDVKSFVKHFLIGELSGNTDTYWSVHMYKKRNDPKFYTGPAWDFDLAYENDGRTHPISTIANYLCFSTKSSCVDGMRPFVTRIVRDCPEELSDYWSKARNENNLTKEHLFEFIDSLRDEIYESQKWNFKRWKILDKKVQQNFQALGNYDAEVDFMKNWLADRITWMDNKVKLKPSSIFFSKQEIDGSILPGYGSVTLRGFTEGDRYRCVSIDGQLMASGIIGEDFEEEITLPSGFYTIQVINLYRQGISKKIFVE